MYFGIIEQDGWRDREGASQVPLPNVWMYFALEFTFMGSTAPSPTFNCQGARWLDLARWVKINQRKEYHNLFVLESEYRGSDSQLFCNPPGYLHTLHLRPLPKTQPALVKNSRLNSVHCLDFYQY